MISTVKSGSAVKKADLKGRRTFLFSEYFKSLLPNYMIAEDSYQDSNREGFIVRFLKIFGYEINQYYYDKITQLPEEWSPLTLTHSSYLDYIAYALGDIPNFAKDEAGFRRLLTFITSIYKIKGRELSFKAILYPLGITVNTITNIALLAVNYDEPGIDYDETYNYDENCATCSEYDIDISSDLPLTSDLYLKILDLIKLVEPIGAKLRTLTYNTDPIEEVHITVEIDINGDLIYNNIDDPDLILTLTPDGDIIISGPNASKYYLNSDGDLIYLS